MELWGIIIASRPILFASWIIKVNPVVTYWICKAHSCTKDALWFQNVLMTVWRWIQLDVCICWLTCGDGTCAVRRGNNACDNLRI